MNNNKGNDYLKGLNAEIEDIKADNLDAIINDLPSMLKDPCDIFVNEVEQEVFLLGGIGVVSGLLPNIQGLYGGKLVEANLYVYVLADYGSGKGGLEWAKVLGEKIHIAKKEERAALMKGYLKSLMVYKKELKNYNDDPDNLEIPNPPKEPRIKLFYFPANNSKTGLYELFNENDSRGTMFETEGDTLSSALSQDFGGYSEVLRNAFHHERISFYRRGNKELAEISRPFLSIVLSGTPDQLKKLIPSTENGLFSRFLYYYLKSDYKFNNVFDTKMNNYAEKFDEFSTKYKAMYDYLENIDTKIQFKISKSKEEAFVKYFSDRKAAIVDGVDKSMAGTANRLGIIAFRIMMILTSLRAYSDDKLIGTIECNNEDYDNALRIIKRLEVHMIRVYEYVGKAPNKKQLAFELKETGTPIREIEKITNINRGTLSRWFNKQ